MKKTLAMCVLLMMGSFTAAFALPIVDTDKGINLGMGSEVLSVNFTQGEFSRSGIDLSSFNADIADDSNFSIASMGWAPNWYQHRTRNRFYGWGWKKGCTVNPDPGGGNSANPVPEPATMLLFGAGLIGLAGMSRRALKK